MTAVTISAPGEDARTARHKQAERTLWDHYGLAPEERFVDVGSPRFVFGSSKLDRNRPSSSRTAPPAAARDYHRTVDQLV